MELTTEEGYKTVSNEERLELIELIHNYNPLLISPTTFRLRKSLGDDYPYLGLFNLHYYSAICSWSAQPRYWLRLLTREEFLLKLGIQEKKDSIKYTRMRYKFI